LLRVGHQRAGDGEPLALTHSDRCHQRRQSHARAANSVRTLLPVLRWPHAHLRDLLARATTQRFEKPSAPANPVSALARRRERRRLPHNPTRSRNDAQGNRITLRKLLIARLTVNSQPPVKSPSRRRSPATAPRFPALAPFGRRLPPRV
jgi:hypothetical protein